MNLILKRYLALIFVLGLMLISLGGCKNELQLKLNKDTITATKNGRATIEGKVSGRGTLRINGKKAKQQPNKKGKFKINYHLLQTFKQEKVKITYQDDKDTKNKVKKSVTVKANAQAIKSKKKADKIEEARLKKEREERLKQEEEERKAEEKRLAEEQKKEEEEQRRLAEEASKAEASKKKAGYTFNVAGTGDEEGTHVITDDEAGAYTIECYYVPMRAGFHDNPGFEDYSDLTGYITVFSDNQDYDMTMDSEQAKYDYQLTSPEYVDDVHAGYDPTIPTKIITSNLDAGNQIQVLNCSAKFTKK